MQAVDKRMGHWLPASNNVRFRAGRGPKARMETIQRTASPPRGFRRADQKGMTFRIPRDATWLPEKAADQTQPSGRGLWKAWQL